MKFVSIGWQLSLVVSFDEKIRQKLRNEVRDADPGKEVISEKVDYQSNKKIINVILWLIRTQS